MPRSKLHGASSLQPTKPLCGRQLSAAGSAPELHLQLQGTRNMSIAQAGEPINCRYCLRKAGLLQALKRKSHSTDDFEDEGEEE